MKHITRYTNNLIDRMTRLPDSGLGRGLSIIAGVAGLILLVGQTYADIDVQTALSNNITTLQQLRTTITGIPTATWKVDISHLGIKLNIPTGPGVLQRDASDYIVLDLVSGSDVANNTITNTNINNNTIQTYNIANYAVTNNAISDNTLQCASLNIPGFNCAPLNQTCGTGLVLQGINASGSMFCTGATAGSGGGLPACGAGQSYVWTGGAWTCLSLLLSANDGSLWDYAPANSGDIYNKNYASGFVGVHTTNPTAELHDVGTFLVGGTGVISTGGWVIGSTGAAWTGSSGTGYLYFDVYSAITGQYGYSYATSLPLCDCLYSGTGSIWQPNQPCNQYQMSTDFQPPTYSYSLPITWWSQIRFPFGYILLGWQWAINDGYYNYQKDVGDFCRRTTSDYGGTSRVRRKYAQCTFPYNFSTPPPSAPAGGYRYTRRHGNNAWIPSGSPLYPSYVASCTTGWSPASISMTWAWTFTTGAYLGKVVCAHNGSIYRERYLDIPTTGYNEINPATCTYITTGNVYIGTGSSGGSSTGTVYYSGFACASVSSLATYSSWHVVYVTGGNVGILTNNPQHTLDVVGTVRSAALLITSDMRKKDNIVLIKGALRKLLRVHGYVYSLILDNTQHYWVLAQEIEKIFPTLVVTDENGTKAVRYNSLIGVIIESLQELNTTLTTNQNMLLDNEHMLQKLEK